ncbi:hypothetical protein SSS_04199 [Sarcoptes scabiei]|nr:hypothetical protein SSS_04199 [Sarcoptes scabiei]
MKQTHENISSLLNSNFGMFVYERLKSQVLPKAVRMLKADLKDDDEDYLQTLASIWKTFYCDILSTLECMLFYIEPFNNVSVRRTTLEIFRDHVLVNSSLEKQTEKIQSGSGEKNSLRNKAAIYIHFIFELILNSIFFYFQIIQVNFNNYLINMRPSIEISFR